MPRSLPLLCAACLALSAAQARPPAPPFTEGAALVSRSERRGKTYSFATLLYRKGGLDLRLESVSPLDGAEAARRAAARLDIYRQLTSPYRLDYAAAADVEIEARGESGVFFREGCGGYGAALFPAGGDLKPAGPRAAKPARLAVAGFLFDPAGKVFTEAVLYLPGGTRREAALAAFRSQVCGEGR